MRFNGKRFWNDFGTPITAIAMTFVVLGMGEVGVRAYMFVTDTPTPPYLEWFVTSLLGWVFISVGVFFVLSGFIPFVFYERYCKED